MRTHRHSGFTLIEAIVALAILAIAATIAVPEFANLIASRRAASAADDLFATLFYARSEAIRQNQPVVVTAIDGDWSNGWEIPNPAVAGTFLVQHAQTGMKVMEATGFTDVTFQTTGRVLAGNAPVFLLCDTKNKAKKRVVTLDLSGLPGVQVTGTCP